MLRIRTSGSHDSRLRLVISGPTFSSPLFIVLSLLLQIIISFLWMRSVLFLIPSAFWIFKKKIPILNDLRFPNDGGFSRMIGFRLPDYQKPVTRSATLHLHNFDRLFRVSTPRREGRRCDSKTAFTCSSLTRHFNSFHWNSLADLRTNAGHVYGMQTVRWKRQSGWKTLNCLAWRNSEIFNIVKTVLYINVKFLVYNCILREASLKDLKTVY